MKYLITAAAFLFSLTTLAGYAGDWTGFGSWKFKGEGPGAHCSPMTITWSETAKTIAIEKGLFDCEVVAMHLGQTSWTIKDGKLFDETNTEVGSYDGTSFQVYMPSPNARTTILVKVQRSANHLDYQEIWFNPEQKIYVIEGRMFSSRALTPLQN